jgi:ubiquinone biosynthesis protein COQ4
MNAPAASIRTLLAPEEIAQGWQMGQVAKPLFAQRWEEAWEKPLAQWQVDLNIQPIQR